MKKINLLIIISIIIFSCTNKKGFEYNLQNDKFIATVGVFQGHGGAQTCLWEAFNAIRTDNNLDVRYITSADIANDKLKEIDCLVIPGGGGSRQYLNLGKINELKIKEFVASGKGIVGICAGAYLLSNTSEYACYKMNGAKAIDIEHDNRGHGIAKMTLNDNGKELFPLLKNEDTCYIMYYEGPVFVEAENDTIKYEVFAMMESDVHEEGNAPSNMTNDKPFIIGNLYGKGKVMSCIAHPESTPGMIWMIPAMVRWTLNMPAITYPENVANPKIINKEILMSINDLRYENSLYETFLYANTEEKIKALDWLQAHYSWSAKRWVQGLLYDEAPRVRARAAEYISETQYIQYLLDMQIAWKNETDSSAKKKIEESYNKLKDLLAPAHK